MKFVIFAAPAGSSQADTILIGPYTSYARADKDATEIGDKYEHMTCIVLELSPPSRIPHSLMEEWGT